MQHTVAVFLEAEPDELDRSFSVVLRLVDENDNPAYLMPGPRVNSDSPIPAQITQQVTIPPVVGTPDGTPGYLPLVLDLGTASLWIEAAARRYLWKIHIGDAVETVGLWATALQQLSPLTAQIQSQPPSETTT
jgi:hypothetical protein